jgi:hypothetical protein
LARAKALAAARIAGNARHTGQSRRGFLASLCGAATTLSTLNEAFAWRGKRGGFFDLPREAAFEPAVVPTPARSSVPRVVRPEPGRREPRNNRRATVVY